MAECKYYKQVRQVSYDNGVTWISLDEFQKGDLYENDSPDCGGGITQYKWVNVSGEYTCVGTTKYQKTKKQQSTDGGQTWTDVNPPEYNTGAVIEYNSSDCGGDSRYENQYLTFVARETGTFKFTGDRDTCPSSVYYSIDNGITWNKITNNTDSPTVQSGQKIMWKGVLTPWTVAAKTFTSTGYFDVEGNIMSLQYKDDFIGKKHFKDTDYTFLALFKDCTKLINAQNLVLPATTLVYACYGSMFEGCTSLLTVPNLPATTLASRCYNEMFSGCTSITSVPSDLLPATTLYDSCYSAMFLGCTSLTNAPNLPATTLETRCYSNMFRNCTSLTTVPSVLPATTLETSCYSNMFRNCTSLTTAPNILATSMPEIAGNNNGVCEFMFCDCTSLTTVPNLLATALGEKCYSYMFNGCTSLATVPSNMLPATTLTASCYKAMFQDCTSLTTAPELPARTLVYACYQWMFRRCSSLNYIKCLATDKSATYCTNTWVSSVSPSGTFVKSSSMNDWPSGTSGIPNNWTIQNA